MQLLKNIILFTLLAFLLYTCKSAPKVENKPPEEKPAEKTEQKENTLPLQPETLGDLDKKEDTEPEKSEKRYVEGADDLQVPDGKEIIQSTQGLRDVKEEDIESSDEQKKYTEELKKGLLRVFQSEKYKRTRTLSRIALNHRIPRVRAAAVLALARVGGKSHLNTLEKLIRTDGEGVRQAAYEGLALIGSPKSIPTFLEGIKSDDLRIKAASFEGIGRTKDPSGRDLILNEGLQSKYLVVLESSLKGLSFYQVPEDAVIFYKFLHTSNRRLQSAAAEALGNHQTKRALELLEQSVGELPDQRGEIIEAIGMHEDLRSVFALLRVAKKYPDTENLVAVELEKKKAYGQYVFAAGESAPVSKEGLPQSPTEFQLNQNSVGKVLGQSKKRYVIDINGKLVEDSYFHIKVENPDGENPVYKEGWVFGSYLQFQKVSPPKK